MSLNGHSISRRPKQLRIIGMQGLGDNLYQRAFIKTLANERDIYLETSWPEFYSDLPVKVVKPSVWAKLRTQRKNVERSKVAWQPPPTSCEAKRISYTLAFRSGRSIINGMEESFGIKFNAEDFGPPPLPESPIKTDKPIAFVRPITVRAEWFNPARNPEPKYLAEIVDVLRPTHHVVTVADIEQGQEWLVAQPPIKADTDFTHGELSGLSMLALLGVSDIIVGGVGFIVPASLALKRSAFVLLGGQAAHNSPARILDKRLDCSRIGFATPKDFCQCSNMRHDCRKAIPDLMAQFSRFLADRPSAISLPNAGCAGSPSLELAISL